MPASARSSVDLSGKDPRIRYLGLGSSGLGFKGLGFRFKGLGFKGLGFKGLGLRWGFSASGSVVVAAAVVVVVGFLALFQLQHSRRVQGSLGT